MLKILLKFSDTVLETFQFDKAEITVGRYVNNDIQIDNLAVSGRHARIRKHGGNYLVEDLESTNGTYLNEKKITKETLKNNDAVTVGKHTLVVQIKKQKGKSPALNVEEMDRTMELDTKRHKEMLKEEKKKKKPKHS